MGPYMITELRIQNFKDINELVVITDIRKCNSMIGLYDSLKLNVSHAIIYAFGAKPLQLQVENIADIQRCRETSCYVRLYLNSPNGEEKIFERRMIDGQEIFIVNNEIMRIAEYKDNLRDINIDLDKQFNLYDAKNRSFFWSMEANSRYQFIAKLDSMADKINSLNDLCNKRKLLHFSIQSDNKQVDKLKQKQRKIEMRLPPVQNNWAEAFIGYIVGLLDSDQVKRQEKIPKLNDFRDQLAEVEARKNELETQQRNAERIVNECNEANRNCMQELQGNALQPYANQTIHSLKIKSFLSKEAIEVNTMRILDCELLLGDLQRYKRAIESHLTFINRTFDEPQDSLLITEDALLKFYQIAHSADELNLDKLLLTLRQKEGDLNALENEKKDLEFFETIFPQLRLTAEAAAKLQNSKIVLDELSRAFKRTIDPNAMLYSKPFPEMLGSLIPARNGFLLTSLFQPANEQHKYMIDSVLQNFKTTIVLYKDDKKAIYDMLKQKYPRSFQNVRFVVLSKLPEPEPNFELPQTHWLNYSAPNPKMVEKLFQFLANHLNILCVESHDEVRAEFQRHSKKYVISFDGQLTYRCLMNVDVLLFFQPGKTPKNMEIGHSHTKKMLDAANEKCADIFASLFEEEQVPRNEKGDDVDRLREEMELLKQNFVRAKRFQTDQIERLRADLDKPYAVPEALDFAERRTIEQRKLDAVDIKIAAVQEEMVTRQATIRNLTTQITSIENCIAIKMRMKTHEINCAISSKTVKEKIRSSAENEERRPEITEEITRLENDLQKLKQSTMRNVVYILGNIDLKNSNPFVEDIERLYNAYDQKEAVDPETIQISIPDVRNHRIVATNDYYANRDNVVGSIQTLERRINDVKRELRSIEAPIINRKWVLAEQCNRFNKGISNNLTELFREMYPEFNYQITFNFRYYDENERMIIVHENGQEIQIENLAETDQEIIHWMLFAAFHRYSNSPILFVDFRDEIDIIRKIDPIIKWITNQSQIFCNSSHGQLGTVCTFANMQIAVNRNVEEIPRCILWRRDNIAEQMKE